MWAVKNKDDKSWFIANCNQVIIKYLQKRSCTRRLFAFYVCNVGIIIKNYLSWHLLRVIDILTRTSVVFRLSTLTQNNTVVKDTCNHRIASGSAILFHCFHRYKNLDKSTPPLLMRYWQHNTREKFKPKARTNLSVTHSKRIYSKPTTIVKRAFLICLFPLGLWNPVDMVIKK